MISKAFLKLSFEYITLSICCGVVHPKIWRLRKWIYYCISKRDFTIVRLFFIWKKNIKKQKSHKYALALVVTCWELKFEKLIFRPASPTWVAKKVYTWLSTFWRKRCIVFGFSCPVWFDFHWQLQFLCAQN